MVRGWTNSPTAAAATVDRFRMDNIGERATTSYFEWLTPRAAENGRILICHTGHEAYWHDYAPMRAMVDAALAEGYCIVGINMPGLDPWDSSNDVVTIAGVPTEITTLHNYAACETDGGTSGTCRFVEPVVIAINQALAERPGYVVCMVGHSGGGWTTEYASAVDSRIVYSASVFGSVPTIVPMNYDAAPVLANWEQSLNNPVVTYSQDVDRHLMRGQSRRSVNVLSDADTVCSPVGKHNDIATCAEVVNARLTAFGGGEYVVRYDTTATDHDTWGAESVPWILADIADYLARRTP